jgi:Phospholipid-translocating ATPase N-terminal
MCCIAPHKVNTAPHAAHPFRAQDAVPSESRTVLLEGGHPTPGFSHNGIKTAKYNPITFAPIFLFEMFSRAAYLYFLIQVLLGALSPLTCNANS